MGIGLISACACVHMCILQYALGYGSQDGCVFVCLGVQFHYPTTRRLLGGGLANQWDKHRGANPQFSLVFEIHISVYHCVKLPHTHSLVVGKTGARAETREPWREFL